MDVSRRVLVLWVRPPVLPPLVERRHAPQETREWAFTFEANAARLLRRKDAFCLRLLELVLVLPPLYRQVRRHHDVQRLVHEVEANSRSPEWLLEIDVPAAKPPTALLPR